MASTLAKRRTHPIAIAHEPTKAALCFGLE
jgi:hypothetical protein